jgi:1,4-dihydroxy-2-naphthoate octaprenyltransferase
MKIAVFVFAGLSLISGIGLIVNAFGSYQPNWKIVSFFLLGIAAILSAIQYTAGKNPYGYRGLGDLFVYIFFGLAGVMGVYFLNTHQFTAEIFLPATSLGLFSTGVLNLNNMRDLENDRQSGKRTIAVLLGIRGAKVYHSSLIAGGIVAAMVFALIRGAYGWNWLWLLSLPPFIFHLRTILFTNDPSILDQHLKKLALNTLLFSVLFGLSFLI